MARRAHHQPQPLHDAFWFRSEAHENLWECFENRAIEPGRFVILRDFEHFGLRTKFLAMGWVAMLTPDPEVYPDLIRRFYYNLEAHDGDGEGFRLTSRVKGVDTSFTCAELAQILHISNDGDRVYCEPGTETLQFVSWDELTEIYTTLQSGPLNQAIQEVNYYPTPRVISKVVQFNILPKGGHRGDPGILQAYITYCIYVGYRLCLPYIIMHRMLYASKNPRTKANLSYGRLLTRIFTHFGVNMEGEEMARGPTDMGETMLKKMDPTWSLFEYRGSPRVQIALGPNLILDEIMYVADQIVEEEDDEGGAQPVGGQEFVPSLEPVDPPIVASSSSGPLIDAELIRQDLATLSRLVTDTFSAFDERLTAIERHLGMRASQPPPPEQQPPPEQ